MLFMQFLASVAATLGTTIIHFTVGFYVGRRVGQLLKPVAEKYYQPLALLFNVVYFAVMCTVLSSVLYFIWT